MTKRSLLFCALATFAFGLAAGVLPGHNATARAQTYPTKAVHIIVPSPAGGGYDLVGRLIAEQLQTYLPGIYVVENVGGPGPIGTRVAARTAPDGYSLLIGGQANLILTLGLYKDVGYDPEKDFIPVGIVAATPYVLIARRDLEPGVAEEIARGSVKPGTLTVATAGSGSGQDILATLLIAASRSPLTKVPYRGAANVYPDLYAGRVDLFVDVISTAWPHVEAEKIDLLATLGVNRISRAPRVPTVAELGMPGLSMEVGSWVGLFGRAGTPQPIVVALQEGITKTMADPNFRRKLEVLGAEPVSIVGQDALSMMMREKAHWLPLMKQAGIEPQ